MTTHLLNRISPLFLACGIEWFKGGRIIGRVHKATNDKDQVTCKNCKRTLLYRGDNANAIYDLLR